MLLRTGVCWAIALAALVFFTIVTYVDALVSRLFNFFPMKCQKIGLSAWTNKLKKIHKGEIRLKVMCILTGFTVVSQYDCKPKCALLITWRLIWKNKPDDGF